MLNNINLIGRWTSDPEIIQANNGTEILNASIAVSDPFNKDHTDFVDVKAFKRTALNTHQYTSKGSKVAIVGKLQQERWENKEGQKRSRHVVIANQIVFLDDKQSNNESSNQSNSADTFRGQGEPVDLGDDLPF